MSDMLVLHALPDRIRVKVPAVRNVQMAQRLEKKVRDVDGIHWARVNSRCAGLVVRFDRSMYSESDIVGLLKQLTLGGRV